MATRIRYSQETIEAALIERERRRRLNLVKEAEAPVWQPYPDYGPGHRHPQRVALESQAHELFYGGSAGSGKSDLLIGAALLKHYKSIIFRRVFPQLRELIVRSGEIFSKLEKRPRYNNTEHVWRGLPDGRTLEFGAMKDEKHAKNYQGRAHDLKGFDEITQFTRTQYTYVIGWNRTTRPNQLFRAICTGNPPTSAEGEWVIEYWAPWLINNNDVKARAGELVWYATIDGEEKIVESGEPFFHNGLRIEPRSRTFIPARLSDNPILAATGYGGVLQGLPEPLRSQLLFGDFTIKPDADQWQIIPTAWVEAAQQRWRASPGPQMQITSVGDDVARGGKDRNVVAILRGNYYEELRVTPGAETRNGELSARLVLEAIGLDPDKIVGASLYGTAAAIIPINVDILGPGSSTYDTLRKAGLRAFDVSFAAPSGATDHSGKLRLGNLRAEAYWKFREALDPDYGQGIMLPPDRELAAELTAAKWEFSQKGIVFVEDKDAIKYRLGRSPDKADAVVLAWLDMAAKREQVPETSHSHRQYGSGSIATHEQPQIPPDPQGGVSRAVSAPTARQVPTEQGFVDVLDLHAIAQLSPEAQEQLFRELGVVVKRRF